MIYYPLRPLFRTAALGSAVLAIVLATTPIAHAQDEPPLPAGTKAPAFTTTTLDGKKLTLSSLRGHVVLLDYWATWCGPCRMAMPTLQSLHRKFGKQGLRVVGMSVDDATTVGQVKPFVKHFGVTFTVTASPANQATSQVYRATGIPSQYLIDKKGIVRWSQGGYSENEGAELAAMIKKLQAERG